MYWNWGSDSVISHGHITIIMVMNGVPICMGSKLTVVHSLPWPLAAFWQQEVIFSSDIIHMKPKSGSQCQGARIPWLGGGFVT